MRLTVLLLATAILVFSPLQGQAQSLLDKVLKEGSSSSGGTSGLGGLFGGAKSTTGGLGGLSEGEIGKGLLEALKVGTGRVVDQVSTSGGYLNDKNIRIPLPKSLQTVQSVLKPLGMSSLTDDLEVRMNQAAEVAAPEAKAVFMDAIANLTMDDVKAIYNGPDDAATRYFQKSTTGTLTERLTPIVDSAMAETGVVKSYDAALGEYGKVPFTKKVKTDLTGHVVEGALGGLFYYLAQEEAAIRKNPAARTTELLQKVFSQ